MRLFLVGLLGAIGALTRYEISRAVHRRSNRGDVPTMIVNLTGAILLGFVVGIDGRARIEPDLLAAVIVGFLGGFTTFSTWMVDVVVLAEEGERGRIRVSLNLGVTLIGGVAGYELASMLMRLPI